MVRSGLTARTRQKQVILPQLGDQGLDCDQMAAGIKTKPLGGPVKPGGNGGAREQLDLSRMQRGGGRTGCAGPSNQSGTVKCSPGAQWESPRLGSSSQSLHLSES